MCMDLIVLCAVEPDKKTPVLCAQPEWRIPEKRLFTGPIILNWAMTVNRGRGVVEDTPPVLTRPVNHFFRESPTTKVPNPGLEEALPNRQLVFIGLEVARWIYRASVALWYIQRVYHPAPPVFIITTIVRHTKRIQAARHGYKAGPALTAAAAG